MPSAKHSPYYIIEKDTIEAARVHNSDEISLKKRYKDLIKIYHPDNLAGDTGTIQEINREYDKLKEKLG